MKPSSMSDSKMTKDLVLAKEGKWFQMHRFSGLERRMRSAPHHPKLWFLGGARGGRRKQKKGQPSLLKISKRGSNTTIDLEQDERDVLKISALSSIAGFDGLGGESPPSCTKGHSLEESFATETIASESEDNEDISSYCDCDGDSSVKTVRFADEVGVAMEQVVHFDNEEEDEADVVVLCLSPQHLKFEFVHVRYHKRESREVESGGNSSIRSTLVSELLSHLPQLCTDSIFQNATFDRLYRTNKSNQVLESLVEDNNNQLKTTMPLEDCISHSSDILVASVAGNSDKDILSSVDSLLSNTLLMKTMRRAKRSQRGLKWIPTAESVTCTTGSRASYAAGILTNSAKIVVETVNDYLGLFLVDDDDEEEEEEMGKEVLPKTWLEEEEEAQDLQDRFEQELMQGVVMVAGLTVVFSLLGM